MLQNATRDSLEQAHNSYELKAASSLTGSSSSIFLNQELDYILYPFLLQLPPPNRLTMTNLTWASAIRNLPNFKKPAKSIGYIASIIDLPPQLWPYGPNHIITSFPSSYYQSETHHHHPQQHHRPWQHQDQSRPDSPHDCWFWF
jgi:hypothetical protein